MQAIEEIEKHYETPDPWGYQTHPDDQFRKKMILQACQMYAPKPVIPSDVDIQPIFNRALDLGAGEGWITKDLPAHELYGYDISEKAMNRFPKTVQQLAGEIPKMSDEIMSLYRFDLITATGIMYPHYDYPLFLRMIKNCASRVVVTCNIQAWEVPEIQSLKELFYEAVCMDFPYREYMQQLRVFVIKK